MNSRFTIEQNVIIKSTIPEYGIVSSNPERTNRLQKSLLREGEKIFDSWGVTVFIGNEIHTDREFFLASVPMGASGSAHAFHELMAAGANNIVRLGSNDVWVTDDDIESVILVKETRGLRGLSWDHGMNESNVDTPIYASTKLINSLQQAAIDKKIRYEQRICFNVDDYHAYLYPEHAVASDRIKERLSYYDSVAPYCRDMESASLYLKAREFRVEVASVLQNVIKQKKDLPYAGDTGLKAKQFELKIGAMVLQALLSQQ